MTVFEELKLKNIDEFAKWIDENGDFNSSPWVEHFDKNYCRECELIKCENDQMYSYCEINGNCKFFPDMEETPSSEYMVKLWLESEVQNEDLG